MNRTEPEIQYYPAIINFLGYVPFEIGDSLPEKLKAYRMVHGFSQMQMALQLKVDESTLWKWETGKGIPHIKNRNLIKTFFKTHGHIAATHDCSL